MRYSIIHHDIRERFELSLIEYVVCDSIHQLSHQYPTTKSNGEVATFLGVDQSSVFRIKERLLEKGLIANVGDGIKTTELWQQAVISKALQNRQNFAGSKDSLPGAKHTIYKEYKEPKPGEAPLRKEIVRDEEKPQKPQNARFPHKSQVFALFPAYKKGWDINKVFCQYAELLYEELGLEDIKEVLEYVEKHKNEPHFPLVITPMDLYNKYENLEAHLERNGKISR